MATKTKKRKHKSQQEIFNDIQKDMDTMIKVFKSANIDGEYTELIYDLEYCRSSAGIDQETNRIEWQRKFRCKHHYCPTCNFFRNRVELKRFYGTVPIMKADPKFKNGKLWLLTLKLPPHHMLETREMINFINAALRRFMNYKHPKNSTQKDNKLPGNSLKDIEVEYSKFMHVGFNTNQPSATVHLHLVLFTGSNFESGKRRITDDMILERWKKATRSPDCYVHKVEIKDTTQDAVDTMAYGLKTLKVETIKKHPAKFIQLFEELNGKHRFSHSKEIRSIRTDLNKQYQQSNKA